MTPTTRARGLVRAVAGAALIVTAASGAEEGGRPDQGPDAAERAGALDPLFESINPSRLQRRLDAFLGLDAGDRSDRPRVPEIPEPVFFDLTRPPGDVKYANELNYLVNSSGRNAPTLQVIEYEFVFADWRSAELDLSYYNGDLQVLTPFYQRTLGVGPRRNWVHGYQLSLDLFLRSGFVGGSPACVLSWKPEEESRFSVTTFVGANRTLVGGFNTRGPMPSPAFGTAPVGADVAFGSWRPMFNIDLFYKPAEKWVLGLETDLFFQTGKSGEYLCFPFVTYEAGKHAFFQVGGGYYHFESRDQFTFLLHVNLVNPSTRRPREAGEGEGDDHDAGGVRGLFARLLGDR